MAQPDVGDAAEVDLSRIGYDELAALGYRFLHLQGDDWVILRGVGADGQNATGILNLLNRVGHGAAAEGCGQTGHCGSMSETGAVVDTVRPHYHTGELLEYVVILVSALG